MAFQAKNLVVGGLAAVALSLSSGAFASVSATNGDNGNNGNNSQTSGVNIGVQSKTNVGSGANGVAANTNGNGNGGSGYGGGSNVDVDNNVWVQIGNVVGGAVNITVNFVTNIFS